MPWLTVFVDFDILGTGEKIGILGVERILLRTGPRILRLSGGTEEICKRCPSGSPR
jgi:hypothetical protein